MSSSEIASTAADGSLDSFSGSGKERNLDFPVHTQQLYFLVYYVTLYVYISVWIFTDTNVNLNE